MSDKKTKVECRLSIQGTEKANAKAIDDLKIPDPEPIEGAQAIKEATEEETEDDSK